MPERNETSAEPTELGFDGTGAILGFYGAQVMPARKQSRRIVEQEVAIFSDCAAIRHFLAHSATVFSGVFLARRQHCQKKKKEPFSCLAALR